MGRFAFGVRAQLPKSKCYTKTLLLEWVQEPVKIHTEHNYYGGIPWQMVLGTPMGSEHTSALRNGKISYCVRDQLLSISKCYTKHLFFTNAYKNISWYIRYRTIMVAFRNKWSWGAPRGSSIRLYQEMGGFPIVYGNNCQIKLLHQKRLVLMPTRTFPGTYCI